MTMDPLVSRTIWHHLEPINAVAYFCPELTGALSQLGFKGFWMGYFAARAAPMGRASAGAVEATFFNFHPRRVRRAIPEAWSYAQPDAVVRLRAEASAASLRRLLSDAEARKVSTVLQPVFDAAIARAKPAGKPIFAGNLDVDEPDDPVAALWQATTTLREHRGDCHVALLAAAGLDGLDALVLFSLSEEVDPTLFMECRGWSQEEWDAAVDSLGSRGLISSGGMLTPKGRQLRAEIERRTDELSSQPYEWLSDEELDDFLGHLKQAGRSVSSSGEIPFPNPIGLPRTGQMPDQPSEDLRP